VPKPAVSRKAKARKADIALSFGERLRGMRIRRGWTQTDLAVHSGLGRPFISNIENGRREPCLRSLRDLAETFGMTVSQLMKGL